MPDDQKPCRWCAEPIRVAAKICLHCGLGQSVWCVTLGNPRLPTNPGSRPLPLGEKIATKPCFWCAEPIRAAARACLCCGRLQPRFGSNPNWAYLFLVMFLLFMFGGLFWFGRLVSPGRDFELFRDRIIVVESQMHFSQNTNVNYISAIERIRNDSPYGWKEIQLEAQYFDRDGRMIDTYSQSRFGDTLPPKATHAFRLRAPADKPQPAYASHKIFVRSAKDARKWP